YPLAAQESGAGAPDLQKFVAVHLWAAGRTVPLHVAARSDGHETYVPLTALEVVGAQFRLLPNGNAVRVTAKSGHATDIPLVPLKGIGMLALSAVARVVDGSVETTAADNGGKPTFQRTDTVYLLARITDARFENGTVR